MNIIDGHKIAGNIYDQIRKDLTSYSDKPKLGIILANDDESSERYVRIKSEKARELGIEVELFRFSIENTSETEIVSRINQINTDNSFHGILVQLPLHDSIKSSTQKILDSIIVEKDVDGLTTQGLGELFNIQESTLISATVEAILECIKATLNNNLVDLKGKEVVIINNSNLIGKPLSIILENYDASVIVLNKYSQDIKQKTLTADIVVTGTGNPQIFDHSYFKKDAVIIDVTSVKVDGVTKGDVIVSKELEDKAKWFTPVPGGVGPLTVACLLRNLYKAFKLQISSKA
jgi:methylenetetrahydrofolate dehydrogenase (NADP+)/methenyltetrahydrofolate cyclohydrolase